MYTDYWKLKASPFENNMDNKMFYSSSRHQEALMRMLYVVKERKGAGMLTGDYGTGKTIITRMLTQHMDSSKHKFVFLTNPQLTALDFVRTIAREISVESKLPDNKSDLLNILGEVLRRNAEISRETIVIVDDAQLIKEPETLEELRLLLSFQSNNRFLITLLFVGQTELRERINRIPQLRQRLAMRYHLESLNTQETGEYILHRLKMSGRVDPLFTDLAIKKISEHSHGIPREINNVCNWCLLSGFSKNSDVINLELVEGVIKELEGQ